MKMTAIRRDCAAGYDEGTLRALLDGELAGAWQEAAQAHVRDCAACGERLTRLRLDGALAQGRLQALGAGAAALDGAAARPPVELVLARARQRAGWPARLGHAAARWRDALGPRLRPAPLALGGAAAAVLLASAALTQPAVQSFAQGVLQSFRVQQVQPVRVDPAAGNPLGAALPIDGAHLEALFQAGTYSGPREPKVRAAALAEATKVTGLALRAPTRLPAQVNASPTVYASEAMQFSFTYDGRKLAQVAQDAGVKDADLLAQLRALDGVTVKGTVPAAAAFFYGEPPAVSTSGGRPGKEAAGAAARTGPFLALFQLRSPSVDVPSSVNVDRLREQVLRSGAVPPALATQLLAIRDWKTTLPVPVVRGTARDVPVDGTTGALVTGEGPDPVLIWQKDGVLYVMSAGSEQDLLAAARSLAPAK